MLFETLFGSLKADNNNDPQHHTNRRHIRRSSDPCVVMVGEQIYPVQDWSMGGILIHADERLFSLSDEMPVTLKFKLGDFVRDITQTARVARKAKGKVAFAFAPLTGQSRRSFQYIMNDCIAAQFADSHMV